MKSLLILLITWVGVLTLQATPIPMQGSHTVTASSANKTDQQKAAEEAQKYAALHALDQMILNQPSAIKQLYEERKPYVNANILDLCTQAKHSINIKNNGLSVTVDFSALIDSDQLKDLLQRTPANKKTVELESMDIAVFFTARQVNAVRKNQEGIQVTVDENTDKQLKNTGTIEDDIVASSSSVKQNTSTIMEVSSIEKVDQISYQLDGPSREEFGTALTSRFAEKGFEEIIDGALLDASSILDEAYGAGDIVSAKTWKAIIANLRETEPSVQYMVVGTLDIGTPHKDALTNMWVVEATVSGKIYKLSNTLPRLVAALAPQTQKARAQDQLQAKKRALSGLTPLAVDEILAKLKAKNIIKN